MFVLVGSTMEAISKGEKNNLLRYPDISRQTPIHRTFTSPKATYTLTQAQERPHSPCHYRLSDSP